MSDQPQPEPLLHVGTRVQFDSPGRPKCYVRSLCGDVGVIEMDADKATCPQCLALLARYRQAWSGPEAT